MSHWRVERNLPGWPKNLLILTGLQPGEKYGFESLWRGLEHRAEAPV
jgi:hypothetical protein